MREYFMELDGTVQMSLKDLPQAPVDGDLRSRLSFMDGDRLYAVLVAALPEGVSMASATPQDFDTDTFLQAGGSADAMLVEIGRRDDGGDVLYVVSTRPADLSGGKTQTYRYADVVAPVYPGELMSWEEALPIFVHYVRNGQTLPPGVWLRDSDSDSSPSFQE